MVRILLEMYAISIVVAASNLCRLLIFKQSGCCDSRNCYFAISELSI